MMGPKLLYAYLSAAATLAIHRFCFKRERATRGQWPRTSGSKRTAPAFAGAVSLILPLRGLIHVVAVAGAHGHLFLLLGDVRDQGFGGEQRSRDGSRALQRRPGDLR